MSKLLLLHREHWWGWRHCYVHELNLMCLEGCSTTGRKNKSSKESPRGRQSRARRSGCSEMDSRWRAGRDLWEAQERARFGPFQCNCNLLVWQNPCRRREVTRQMATFISIGLGTERWNANWQSSFCQVAFQWVGVPGGIFTPYQLQHEVDSPENTYQGVTKTRSGQTGSSFSCSASSTTLWT